MAKILVVDDDFTVQLILQDLLESVGHQVCLAEDGETGLKEAINFQPDVMICDWMMPQMDGLEVCRRVKATPELTTTFFILLTAREQVDDRVKGLDTGADDFLSKPIETQELLARVRAGLRTRQLMQQLSQTNQQLNQTLQELQQTQAQLVQSAKMSSIGSMVGGIAHEINNPVTFIYGNLRHVQNYAQELLELAHLCKQEGSREEIEAKLEAIDLNFLLQDLPKVLDSMYAGANRIRSIVQSLMNFTQLNRSEKQAIDIHEGIDNTLSLLQHRLQVEGEVTKIQVVKEYGNLPKVECSGGLLNQVFMNIISNAIDALEDDIRYSLAGIGDKSTFIPTITIRTQFLNSNLAVIQIADNGPGMNKDVLPKIFDPFFTTKPVGKGTGLGLSISYQIIEKQHGGVLKCFSEPGKGSEFWVQIPTEQEAVGRRQ